MIKEELLEWLVKNIDENVVPSDEGNGEALLYNLCQIAIVGKEEYDRDRNRYQYDYEPSQDAFLESLFKKYGVK